MTDDLCALLGPAVRETYPKARCGTSKRGPKLWFNASVDGQDPTVDLVVALTRRDGDGLWIPNLEKDRWEPSHPEGHVGLFNAGPAALRQTRRIVTRLLKAWNKQDSSPGMSSFNLSVLAWEFVVAGAGVPAALHTVLDRSATRISRGYATPDPAGVSAPLKLLPVDQRQSYSMRQVSGDVEKQTAKAIRNLPSRPSRSPFFRQAARVTVTDRPIDPTRCWEQNSPSTSPSSR